MAQDFGTTEPPFQEPRRTNRSIVITIIVLIVLCCCCAAILAGYWLWNNGDQLLEQLNIQVWNFLPFV
jgi:hypothetical protein